MAKPDRGAALALVLWGLVIGGALLTSVTMLAVQEQRAAGALRQEALGLVGAERAGTELIERLTVGRVRLLGALDSLPLDAGADWRALLRRLAPDVFLLEVTPRLPAGVASREAATVRLGWLLHPGRDSVVPVAAVSVGTRVALGDAVVISGTDNDPAGLDSCPAPDSAIAGIAAESIYIRGSAELSGAPPELLGRAGDLPFFDRFSERATVVLPGGSYVVAPATVGTSCDTRIPMNWGDPGGSERPCGTYLPIIRVDGDLTLNGGDGQGILLVNGDLHVAAPFAFDGIVIVKGAVDITAPTAVRGILEAAELRSGSEPVTQLKVHYSNCIISRNLESSSPLTPLASRAWIQLFQAP